MALSVLGGLLYSFVVTYFLMSNSVLLFRSLEQTRLYSTADSPQSAPSGKPKGKPTRLTKEQKAALVIPENTLQLITGMILSDAHLYQDKRAPNGNARLKIQQKDKEFVRHLWDQFYSLGFLGALPKSVKT